MENYFGGVFEFVDEVTFNMDVGMDAVQAYLENMKLISTLAGLLAGLTFAIVPQLIHSEKKSPIEVLTLLAFIFSAGCFVISTFNGTFMVIGVNTQLMEQTIASRDDLPIAFHISATLATLGFLGGLMMFIVGLGSVGWLHSKLVGFLSTATAAMCMLFTLGIFMILIAQIPD